MSLEILSLVALLVVVAISCLSSINLGLLALTFAWVIGAYIAPAYDATFSAKKVIEGFPADLMLQLVGMSWLFTQAQLNGTLARLAQWGVKACRGNAATVSVMFFLLAGALSAIGAGNIAAVALVAPTAMVTAARLGISPLLMAIMVGHGSVAGALSPFTPMGIIADNELTKIGLADQQWYTCGMNFLTNLGAGLLGYLLCRGWQTRPTESTSDHGAHETLSFERRHHVTLLVLGVLFVGILFFKVHLGFGALAATLILIALGAANEQASIVKLPWGVVFMVTGMSTLVSLCERTGGLKLLSVWLAGHMTDATAAPLTALVTGVISLFSSTSAVVLPTFLPMVQGMADKLPGVTPLAIATAVNIGGNLVDVSPVSTIGALCLAAAPESTDRARMYRLMLIWGASMALVAAAVCAVLV